MHLRGTHCGRSGGENQMSRAQCRVKSGTPVAVSDAEAAGEKVCAATPGKVQASAAGAKIES